jgi:hypothetical protein
MVYRIAGSHDHFLVTLSLSRSQGILEFSQETKVPMWHDEAKVGEYIVKMSRNLGDRYTKIIFSDGVSLGEGHIDADL